MGKIFFYNRQSSDKQTLKNGEEILNIYMKANKLSYEEDKFKQVDEQASAFKYGYKLRKLGTVILPIISKNDTLLVTEISRISRKSIDIQNFIENEVLRIGFKLIIMSNGMIIDDSIMSRMMVQVFAMMSEMEVRTMKKRTKIGIQRYKKEHNGEWGRRKGTKNKKNKLDNHKDEIIELLTIGLSKKKIADKYKVCPLTLRKFIKLHQLVKH